MAFGTLEKIVKKIIFSLWPCPLSPPPLLREDFFAALLWRGKICVSCKIQLKIKIMKYQKSSQKILNVSLAHSGNFHKQGTFFSIVVFPWFEDQGGAGSALPRRVPVHDPEVWTLLPRNTLEENFTSYYKRRPFYNFRHNSSIHILLFWLRNIQGALREDTHNEKCFFKWSDF